uniref:Fam20C domain-containing protein n=1 Tax=Rhodnius prolixus TaxID=13249 RepID=T1HJI1_RHOPR
MDAFYNELKLSKKYIHNFSLLLTKTNVSYPVDLWSVAAKWVNAEQVVPKYSPLLHNILQKLELSKIIAADILPKGSQLKILLTLEGHQKALFKPKWYERNTIIEGTVYSGKDRHNGEIAAFHLSRLLELNRAPIVSGRILNLDTEILPVSTYDLSRTFYKNGNNTCFYGVCIYCKPDDGVCAKGSFLEGSIALWLPNKWETRRARHPWQRTYNKNQAMWEMYTEYCDVIKKAKPYKDERKLLDLVETSVFDFLIDNGDRHHYEHFSHERSKVLLIDNAKSFGNPYVDHIDILAPLYQCCRIREKFVSVLISLKGKLGYWLQKLMESCSLAPILTKDHLNAMDRRLNSVLATIMVCIKSKSIDEVLVMTRFPFSKI